MGLTLDIPPGFSDLSDSVLAAEQPTFGINIARIYNNAAFGLARTEVFVGNHANGDTVPLPVSPIDGYTYSRDELIYVWTPTTSANTDGWISAKSSLWSCAWMVDQSTGAVISLEYYMLWAQGSTRTNDGTLTVFTIAQRAKTYLIMGSVPSWPTLDPSWIGPDEALQQQLIQGLNAAAKFAISKTEVFYLGEFYNGQTVSPPTSPIDGHHYSLAECKLIFSWRWTVAGNISPMQQPRGDFQLGPFTASIDPSTGVVSTSVYYSSGGGDYTNGPYGDGRLAVFAFCRRSGSPGSITPTADNFAQMDEELFLPGNELEYPELSTLIDDIHQAVLTPEFFGPTIYGSGDTVPLPTSPVDGYVYSRSELTYVWAWAQVSTGNLPLSVPSAHARIPLFSGSINPATGYVTLDAWHLPPGGPYVDRGGAYSSISVIVIARRQQEAAPPPVEVSGTNPQSDYSTVATDIRYLRAVQVDDLSSACNGATTGFTLSQTPFSMAFMLWNGQARFDFSQTGTAVTTTFTPDTGDKLYAFYFV